MKELIPTRYSISDYFGVFIEARKFEGIFPKKWAVLKEYSYNHYEAMSKKTGIFNPELLPSSRTDNFLREHRFNSPEEALAAFKKFHAK